MSKEYIDRKELLELYQDDKLDLTKTCVPVEVVIQNIKDMPAADVVEVVRGKWKFQRMTGEKSYWSSCSNCGILRWFKDSGHEQHYCDHCGAKMDGGKANE